MATLDWQLRRTDGITLVQLSVTSETDKRVRIESNLSPVWPPRRQGVPAAGWTDDAFEGQVSADGALALGYASPAEPEEPPATIRSVESAPTDAVTPRAVVRTLGEIGPPRDAVKTGTADRDPPGARSGSKNADARTEPPKKDHGDDRSEVPTAWLDAVEDRLAAAEQLADADGVGEAREAVESAGGLDAVRHLQAALDADRDELRQLRRRTDVLAERLDAVEVPLAALERVT